MENLFWEHYPIQDTLQGKKRVTAADTISQHNVL